MVGRLVLDVPGCILEVGVWISSSSLLSSPDASLANIIFFVAASAATAMGGRGGGWGDLDWRCVVVCCVLWVVR